MPKRHLEINWPLGYPTTEMIIMYVKQREREGLSKPTIYRTGAHTDYCENEINQF